jgi:hypothetical protein
MQDGWLHRSSTWDGANPPPDRQALPSLRSVAPRSASAAMTSSTTTGAASSSAGHPSFRSAAPLGYQGEYQQHRPLHRAEQQQYSPEYARYPAYHEHQGDRERVYVKQEAAFEPLRDVYASPAHVFALPPPPAAAPALPKLSHMLRASSLNDVKAARPPWIQEPETEPDYTRRLAGLRTPIADRDRREIGSAKSSIGFILGGQNHATYTSSSTTMLPPARPSTIPSSSSSSGYYNQYPPHQPAPPSMTVHSSSSLYWSKLARVHVHYRYGMVGSVALTSFPFAQGTKGMIWRQLPAARWDRTRLLRAAEQLPLLRLQPPVCSVRWRPRGLQVGPASLRAASSTWSTTASASAMGCVALCWMHVYYMDRRTNDAPILCAHTGRQEVPDRGLHVPRQALWSLLASR